MVALQSSGVIGQTSTNVKAPDWVSAHEQLSRLAKARAAADAEEGRWLLCALRSAAHVHLGFGSFAEYIERLFGYRPRSTQEKLRVAEALEELPETSRALASGGLSWSAVRELTRVATPETEREWLDVAHGKTTRQLAELVTGKVPGDQPNSPSREGVRRHVLRFEVSAETFALVREAMAKLRRGTNHSLDDDSALLLMARHVLGGPDDDGRAPYQVALTVCRECGSGFQQARGELVEVGPEVIAMAECDCQHLGHIDVHAIDVHANGTDVNGADVNGNAHDAHAGASQAGIRETQKPRARATQRIPPALRRTVLRRDHHRCVVPGCSQSVFVDVHHLQPRSEAGKNEEGNLTTLCAAHHRANHRGELTIRREISGSLSFWHADGTPYGKPVTARTADAFSKAFAALRAMGFRETQVRRTLDALRLKSEVSAADTERILREALILLTPEC